MPSLEIDVQRSVVATLKSTSSEDSAEQYGDAVIESMRYHMCSPNILDRLVVLFDVLSQMVTTSTNARAEESVGADDNSVMGFYLRRCWCDFTALPFEGACQLSVACERYAEPLLSLEISLNSISVEEKQDTVTSCERKSIDFRSRVCIERFLEAHNSHIRTRYGNISRESLIKPLKILDKATPGLPTSYLNQATIATFDKDISLMKENVHRHGDAAADPYIQSIGVVSCGDSPNLPARVPRAAAAPLIIAAMHARLGQVKAAMNTLDEAMRTFQQASDDASLVHALAVLCQILSGASPGSVDLLDEMDEEDTIAECHAKEVKKLLNKCLERAERVKLPHIAAYARLSLAKQALVSPFSYAADDSVAFGSNFVQPCAASLEIANASRYIAHLDFSSSTTAAVPVPPASNGGLACLRIVKGLADMFSIPSDTFGPSLMGAQASSAAEVSRLGSSISLLKALNNSVLSGNRRLSMAYLTAFFVNHLRTASLEDKAAALAHAAIISYESYGFRAAQRVLDLATRFFCYSDEPTPLLAARLTIANRRAIHRGDIRYALELASRLVAISLTSETNKLWMKIEGEEAIVRSLIAGGHYTEAGHGAQKVFEMTKNLYLPIASLRLMVLIGRIHLEARVYQVAIPYFISALRQASKVHGDLIVAEALILLSVARSRLDAGYLSKAISDINTVMPLILAHGCLDLRSRVRLLLSELILERETTRSGVAALVGVVVPLLKAAARDAEKIEDWSNVAKCWHLTALVFDSAGYFDARDAASKRFLRIKEQLSLREKGGAIITDEM